MNEPTKRNSKENIFVSFFFCTLWHFKWQPNQNEWVSVCYSTISNHFVSVHYAWLKRIQRIDQETSEQIWSTIQRWTTFKLLVQKNSFKYIRFDTLALTHAHTIDEYNTRTVHAYKKHTRQTFHRSQYILSFTFTMRIRVYDISKNHRSYWSISSWNDLHYIRLEFVSKCSSRRLSQIENKFQLYRRYLQFFISNIFRSSPILMGQTTDKNTLNTFRCQWLL